MLQSLVTKLEQMEMIVDQDDIAKQVHEEVACIYFDFTKVNQGDRNKLWLVLIKSIKEKAKVKLSAKALNYVQKKFIPVVPYSCFSFISQSLHSQQLPFRCTSNGSM
jgi:hypothetical protein